MSATASGGPGDPGGGGPRIPAEARFLLGLLERLLPSDWAEDILGDLKETYRRRRSAVARLGAGLWLSAQVVLFAGRFALEALRERAFGWRRSMQSEETGPGDLLTSVAGDVRYAFKVARRSPIFFGAVILTLAVGIGANTAIYSVVEGVVLDPLPYPDSDRLVVVDPNAWTPAGIVDGMRERSESLDALEGYYPRSFAVSGEGRPAELDGAVVTPGFLPLLGVDVSLGRGFLPGDTGPDAPPTVLLSYGLWQRRYGGAPDVLERTIRIDGRPRSIVGVVERGFRQLTPRTGEAELWIAGPLDDLGRDVLPEGSEPWAIPLARLRPDLPLARAQEELDAAAARHVETAATESDSPNWDFRWVRLEAQLTEGVRPAVFLLQAAVAVLLLLACVNVANLLLVRFASRRGEVALRTALGAGRSRITRQLLTESLALALLGGLAGMGLAALFLEAVLALAPADIPRLDQIGLDGSVLLVTLGVSMATGLLFGVVPALVAAGRDPGGALGEARRSGGATRGRHRVSQALVVVQVALTLVLVTAAGLLTRSLTTLASREPGFRTEGVVTIPVSVPEHAQRSMPGLVTLYGDILERLERVPGVRSAAVSNRLPINRGSTIREVEVEGRVEPESVQFAAVSPDYFRVLDIPRLQGRRLEDEDRRSAPGVTVVDAALARRLWPEGNAVGRRLRLADTEGWMTVVGVVADIRGSGLAGAPEPGIYISFRQRPDGPVELGVAHEAVFLAHVDGGLTEALAGALREAVWDVDPGQPLPEVATLEAEVARDVSPLRFRAILFGAFAAIALVLAVVGIYGVIGYVITERTHEFGVRKALGARDVDVVGRVLLGGLGLSGAGVVLGIFGVRLSSRWLESILFGVAPGDPMTLAVSAAGVVALTLAACFVPAWRASRVDPTRALRSER